VRAGSAHPIGAVPTFIQSTVPVGSNPTGCSSSVERKLEVLQICKEYGILILEDDPYCECTGFPRQKNSIWRAELGERPDRPLQSLEQTSSLPNSSLHTFLSRPE
jgi:DNA-binding transcriptional MocR family regulator